VLAAQFNARDPLIILAARPARHVRRVDLRLPEMPGQGVPF
jgi:hypothetical protein